MVAAVHKLRNTSSVVVANTLSASFSFFGVPELIISDNGPQYAGQPFRDMCKKWGIEHTTSSPRYPRSNGMAERNVRTIKGIMKKCRETGQGTQVALLHYRATPLGSNIPSPAELLLGRQIRTTLPSHLSNPRNTDEVQENMRQRQVKMKEEHDRTAGPILAPLPVDQRVRVLDERKCWIPARVSRICEERNSYVVETPNGSSLRRNRSHLRELHKPSTI
eukprot:XP_011668251.1 PREDICTED: uncharacterized protein K02A2.6-like [Strongylocentrotus purpuratus]